MDNGEIGERFLPLADCWGNATDMADTKKRDTDSSDSTRNVLIAAGVATGIGSAALVAALLYANRGKKEPAPSKIIAEPTD